METLRALAVSVDENDFPLSVKGIALDAEGQLVIIPRPGMARIKFTADQVVYQATITPGEEGAECLVTAELGFLPFTIESRERRATLLTILQGTRRLPRIKFAIANGQKICLTSTFHLSGRLTPYRVIYEMAQVAHEAGPFLRLLSEYL
jgi:hypothetical protein